MVMVMSSRFSGWSSALWLLLGTTVRSAPVELDKRAISASLLDQLQLYSQWSAAAYCGGNNNSTGTKITCPQGNCPRVEADNTRTLTEFENTLATDTTGFVATDTTASLIVVSFRGSRSVRNWLADVEFPVEDTTICSNCSASTGFWTSWLEAQTGVINAVKEARAAYPSFKVIVTGHSLGGAVATLAAGVLRSQGINVDLYTYGAPKVGLEALAADITSTTNGSTYRVTHLNDPVPRLPPVVLGFRHPSPEYYISSGDATQPTTSDVTRYDGLLNYSGNEGNTGIDIDAHLYYFGNISACDGTEQLEIR